MRVFSNILDKASAAFVFFAFLIFATVKGQCPLAADSRTNDCRTTYTSLVDGNLTRTLDVFAGKLKAAYCIAHCGCISKSYAGLDSNGHCFCGNVQGNTCSGGTECQRVYSTTGIPGSPSATFPSKMELFSGSSVNVIGLSNVLQFAVANEGKLSYFTPSAGTVAFVETGERKVSVEIEGYWGCRTPDYTVNVYSTLIADLVCPSAVRPNQEFFCWVTIFEGSGIQSLKWTLDGAPSGAAVTSVAAPLVIPTGGNMTVDRFDEFNSTCDVSSNEATTFINPNYEFTAAGRVKAFEAHITRQGEISFQIFRPLCDQIQTEKTYCHSQRKCVSSGCGTPSMVRGNMEFYPPSSKPVFCPDVERFKVDDNSTCPTPEDFATVQADYQLLFQYTVNVTQNGNTVIKLPNDQNFTVQPGDVLGWTTGCKNGSGDIGYYRYDNAYEPMYAEYQYKEVFEIVPNSIFSRALPTASVFKYYHLLRAHISNPANYLKQFKFEVLEQTSTVGISLVASESTVTKSTAVSVEEDITGFTFTATPTDVMINTDVTFAISSINTDVGVGYSFHFGETAFNGTFDQMTSTKSIKKQFAVPGIYTVICRATNKLGSVDKNVTVYVYADIVNIEFTKEVDPKATGETSISTFVVNGLGNATVTYNLGDKSTNRLLNVTMTKHLYVEINYIYASKGDYLINVEAKNPLQSKSTSQYASVEDTINGVVIVPPGVAATNVTHSFSVTVQIGTNVTHVWSWEDGTPNDTSTVNNRNMAHNYTTYGNRTITVYSYNKISNFTCTRFIEVQDIIKGLNFTQPVVSPYIISPANQSDRSETWFTLEQGTGMDIYVDWDANRPGTVVSLTAYDRDKNNEGGFFVGWADHQYSSINTYNVTVYVKNEVSEMNVTTTAIYEVPIARGVHTMQQQDLTTNYIEVNETVCFTMKPAAGTNTLMRCDFDDKFSEPVITPNTSICHSWTYWQLPFRVNFTIYNNVSQLFIPMLVDIQMPVHNFTNLRIFGGPENTTEAMELVLEEPTGDYFNCTWTIRDTTLVTKNLLYTDFLANGVISKMFIKHQFQTPGIYDVEVECKNRLYSAKAKTNVTSCKAVSDFNVDVVYGGQCGAKKLPGSRGDGPENDMYAYGCPLKFTLSGQTGSNITNTFQFGDGSPVVTEGDEATYTFSQTPGENSKTITITASNPTSTVKKTYLLKFLPRITGLSVGNSGPVKVGKPLTFNVTVQEKGLGSCFLVEFESSLDMETKTKTISTFWMGEDSCRYQTKYKGLVSKPDLDPSNAKWVHTFEQTGNFRCTVTGENSVSLETAFTDVVVLDKPCNKPKVEWNGIEDVITNPTNITRGEDKTIQVKVTKDCEKTDEVEYNWNITLHKEDGSIEIITSVNHSKTDSALKIPARTLAYGTYGIHLTLCMKDVYPPVCTTITGFIKVNPSIMVAQFEGGSGRAGGKDRILQISAMPSHDPDTSLTFDDDIKVAWCCKRQSEIFPDNLEDIPDLDYPEEGPAPEARNSSLNVTSSFKGCFGNGIGRLRAFDNMKTISINSSFMPLKEYFTIRIFLSKENSAVPRENVTSDYSLYIVPGDPPEIKISCVVNCGNKKNPDKPFKLQAVCAKHCNNEIAWKWTMKRKVKGALDKTLEPISTFGQEWLLTKDNQKNLAMKDDMMQAAYEYQVRLTGSLVGFSGTEGFSMYDIKVNIRPTVIQGRSRVIPAIGEPFQKIFKLVFSGFNDEDLPLTYFADYKSKKTNREEDWVNFYQSLSPISDLMMFPSGEDDGKVEIRFYCEDTYRAKSGYSFVTIVVKSEKAVDLNNVLESSGKTTDPAAAGQVANAVLSGLGQGDSSADNSGVVDKIVDMMDNVEVNSPAGALALSTTLSTCMDAGMSPEKQAKAMEAMTKCASQMGPDTPADIVNGVATATFSVLLKGGDNGGGDASKSDDIKKDLGTVVALNMVPGEAPFVKSTGKSRVQSQAMDPESDGGVSLGSGGGFDMDSSALGAGTFQAVSGNGPDNYSNKSSSAAKDVTSDVVSLDMASGGKPMKVENLTTPIVVNIKQPINPYPPARHVAYTHLLKSLSVIDVQQDNESSIFIEIKNETEMYDSCFFVIIKKGSKPKLYDNDYNFTLPHIVTSVNPDGTNKTAKQIQTEQNNRFRIILHGKRDLNSTAIGRYYLAVLNSPCNTTNVSLPIMTSESDVGVLNVTIPPRNYTFMSYTGSCRFFNKTSKKWSNAGLDVLPDTTQNYTVCATLHLSSFAGGSVFAKPNTIDFSKAFAGFSNIGENPTVFATTLSIIGIYFVLLAYCRYKDKKDLEKIGVFPLEDNHPSDNYLYEVAVQTGFTKGAGSTADVFIVLNGTLGETSPRKLHNPNRRCFNKGDTDAFLLTTPYSLGVLKSIEIWHNNEGHSPGWYCMQVQIKDLQADRNFIFVCNRWLAVEEDDGQIKRTVDIATKDDLVQFDFLFAQTARKNLYDGHIWFSIFTRPPRSHFTRCQRLGCCLVLLLTSMLANAMFYKDPAPATATDDPNAPKAEASDSIHLGPITISVEQIKIGFTSSLVVVPVNLIIATLFQKAKPKEDKKKKEGDKYKADGEEDEESAIGSSRQEVSASRINLVEKSKRLSVDATENEEMNAEELEIEKSKKRANFLKMICLAGNEDDDEDASKSSGKGKKKAKPKAFLPHWVIYIAYVLIFLASGTAAFFVILYGFQFGKEKSDNWMKSMMLSFWQSVILIQPVKVLALSVLFAMIIKDPKAASGDEEGGPKAIGKDEKAQEGKKKKKKKIGENGEELDEDESESEEEGNEDDRLPGTNFKLPDEKKLEEARQLRLKEKKMRAIIREIVIHLLFVMLCLFIGYSNMDPFAVGYGTSVKSFTGGELEKVTKVEEYWKWVEGTFIPYLYPGKWYNGISPYKVQFVADNEPSKVISMARMRQLRVKKNTCTKHPVFENIISECNGPYSWSNEDTEQYSAGWKPPLNKTETRKLRHRKRKALWLGLENAWQYQSVLKLKNFPFLGQFGTYSGSSYAVSVGPDERISRLILKSLKDNFWIDRYTRAIFHEINIYNANTNLMMIFTLVSEIINTGGWNYFDNVQALRLYRWQGGLGGIIAIADLIFMVVTLVGLYKLVKTCRKIGIKNYLKSAWNFLHAFVTVFSICTFSCVFARVGAVMWAMKQYKADPEVFVSFAYLGQLDYFVQAFIGFVVMATNLEFLRLLRFNKKIGLLTATIRQSMKPLASFGIIFAFIFLSYVSLAHLLFVSQLEDYKNFGISVVSLTRMFLGQFDVESYRAIAPFLGPMLFFTYMVAIQMVLINMFIGIICETFEEVRIDIEKQSNDHEIVSFMTNRFKKIAGAAVGPSVDPIYREWKSDWEVTMDSIEEKSDSIIYLLRNVEAEEVRQARWFEPSLANEKKKNLLTMVVGSDEFTYENELLDTLQLLDKRMKKITVEKSQKMLYTMAKKKKKEKEDEAKSRAESRSIFSEDESDEDGNEETSDEDES